MPSVACAIRLMKQDYQRFCRLVKIRHKSGGLARYRPRVPQLQMHEQYRRKGARIKLTKARQLGFTTELVIGAALHYCLFNRGVKAGLAAHHAKSAQEIFQIARTAYDNLPAWFRNLPQFKEVKNSANALQFGNGSSIMVGTANSEFWRGSTFQRMILTECAYYQSLKTTITAIAQVVPDDGVICLETTANGPNDWKDFWDQDNGYRAMFYSWLDDPTYQTDEPFAANPETLLPYELDYIVQHRLPLERANWFVKTLRQKCFSNMNVFSQEYPINPGDAFIESGSRYFHQHFQVDRVEAQQEGWVIQEPPQPNHLYTCGIDASSGSPDGDYGFITIMDVTDPMNMRDVASWMGRAEPAKLAAVAADKAIQYSAVINPESNNHGTAVVDALKPFLNKVTLYRHVELVNGNRQVARQYGTEVNSSTRPILLMRLYRALALGHLQVRDPRILHHLNQFQYNRHGRPEAQPNQHDDGVFALAHALYCCSAASLPSPKVRELPPVPDRGLGMAARLQYEINTGHLITEDDYDDFPAPM